MQPSHCIIWFREKNSHISELSKWITLFHPSCFRQKKELDLLGKLSLSHLLEYLKIHTVNKNSWKIPRIKRGWPVLSELRTNGKKFKGLNSRFWCWWMSHKVEYCPNFPWLHENGQGKKSGPSQGQSSKIEIRLKNNCISLLWKFYIWYNKGYIYFIIWCLPK